MEQFNPEGLDLPPPEGHNANRVYKSWVGRLATRTLRRQPPSDANGPEVQVTMSRIEALFEAEIVGTDVRRLVETTVPLHDGYHLEWLLAGTGENISHHRLEVVVPIWRAHNAESLASLVNFFAYVHSDEESVTMQDLQEFIENGRAASKSLLRSLAEH